MNPLTFIKNHPLATVVLMGTGMVVGPWVLGTVNRVTGVGVSLPSVGNAG